MLNKKNYACHKNIHYHLEYQHNSPCPVFQSQDNRTGSQALYGIEVLDMHDQLDVALASTLQTRQNSQTRLW